MISKDSLVFDTTDTDTIAASDNVGAFVRSSDGTLIDHATIDSVERLAVDSTLKDGAGTALTSTLVGGKQALDVYIAEGINVEVDLDAADDSVLAHLADGAGTALTSTLVGDDQALDVNIVQSIDAALANTAIATAATSLAVADTAQDVVASPLADRKYLYIKNMDNREIYIGASGVTSANGFPLSPKAIAELRLGAAVDIEFVGATGATPAIRIMQLS
jgi:hypothetical protein